ncbi:MAG: hypothetical protein LW604_05520 [Sediminibacterium sp.]|nr:hypothetical protein [Sediminibacterium sp.]
MKAIYILIGLVFVSFLSSFAQNIPTGIPFQGIAKDFNGNPVNERKIYIQTNLISGTINSKTIYTEEHETQTDAIGVFSIMIGHGKRTQGAIRTLSEIKWEEGPYFLGIQLAITPNAPLENWKYQNNWINMGTTSLGIVPYAFYSLQTMGLDAKLNTSDTADMLRNYVKVQVIKLLDSAISTKLSAKDTGMMLAPYSKVSTIVRESIRDTVVLIQTSTNSSPILSFSGEYDSLKNKPILFSGAYNDLTDKPLLFDGNYSNLSNKPSLFDGNYNNLSNKPFLFDGDYNTLNNKPTLFNGDYNALSNKPILTLNGDITNNGNITTLANSGVSSGTYGSGLAIPIISVDEKGRITSATTSAISPYSFPNKTHTQKIAMTSIGTGTVIWCSDCGTRGQMQVYNGYEWTDLTGAAGLTNSISFGSISSTNISAATVSITTTINSDGGNSITSRGVVWNTSINPTIALSTKTNSGTGTGTFTTSLSGLTASTVYYIRTYATNANGTVYGNEISFTTTGITPSLTTTAASSTTISSFITGGSISSDGGNLVTYRGVCWSTNANPTINDNKILSGTGTGTFTITLSNLNVATTYYVRSFATNSAGTAYGNERVITTSSLTAGTTYLGGKIAYIFQSGDAGFVPGETHGFIIMEHKMGMTAVFGSDGTYYSNGGTTMAFGYGMQNTRSLAGKSWNNFAKYIYNVSFHGYSDWYVPSYYEWSKIGPNWRYLGIPNGYFHASSESGSNSYYFYSYDSYGNLYTSIGNSSKTSVYDIIGIRNF